MINLLPSNEKEELRQEEIFKLVLILGIVILAILTSLTLVLFSIKISLLTELETQKFYLEEKEKELKSPRLAGLEEKIKALNLTLAKLSSFYQGKTYLTEILEEISQTLPEKTYLTSLNFNAEFSQFSLSGFSPDRATLLQFKENLEREKKFTNIYFSPASWLEPKDINFSVNFSIKK